MSKFSFSFKETPFWVFSALKIGICVYCAYLGIQICIANFFQEVKIYNFASYHYLSPFDIVCYLALSLYATCKLRRKYLWWITLFVAFECICCLFELYVWQKGGLYCYQLDIGVVKIPAKLLLGE